VRHFAESRPDSRPIYGSVPGFIQARISRYSANPELRHEQLAIRRQTFPYKIREELPVIREQS
jgi:hypothetical protein